jgi:Uma2 family endonuclease
MMAPERAAHALTKLSAQIALREGVHRVGLQCRVFPDGMTVRIAARSAFEPDALVCPPPTDLNTLEIPNPVIAVEVLSPSTAADDHGIKLDGYFSLASVHHYLIVDPDRRMMIHHRRAMREQSRPASCAKAWWFSTPRDSRLRWPPFSQRSERRSHSAAAHRPEGPPGAAPRSE